MTAPNEMKPIPNDIHYEIQEKQKLSKGWMDVGGYYTSKKEAKSAKSRIAKIRGGAKSDYRLLKVTEVKEEVK